MKEKITREKVLYAAVETLRSGMGLNARNIAKVLDCSTQPIYSLFTNMDEIKMELHNHATRIQKEKVEYFKSQKDVVPYKAYGLGFVRFAKDEKELFKFLYMQSKSSLFSQEQDVLYDEIIKQIQKGYGLTEDEAKQFHLDMSIYTYGLAVLQSIGRCMTDEEVADRLQMEFVALASGYKHLKTKRSEDEKHN